jgi:hypothetical protein
MGMWDWRIGMAGGRFSTFLCGFVRRGGGCSDLWSGPIFPDPERKFGERWRRRLGGFPTVGNMQDCAAVCGFLRLGRLKKTFTNEANFS